MFLILLIIFPIFSYYIFNKNTVKNSNWVVMLIWIVWILVFKISVFFEIFNNSRSFLSILIIWYIIVFIFYYFECIRLQFRNINKFKFNKWSYIFDWILKLLFLLLIIILYISIIDNYEVNKTLWIFSYNSNSFINFIFKSLSLIALCWVIFAFIEMIKNGIFRIIKNFINSREELKKELKLEILKGLKNEK